MPLAVVTIVPTKGVPLIEMLPWSTKPPSGISGTPALTLAAPALSTVSAAAAAISFFLSFLYMDIVFNSFFVCPDL